MEGSGSTIGVLYPRYHGLPVMAQHNGHDLLHELCWSWAPSARDDRTAPDQGRQGPPIPGGSLRGTDDAARDPETSWEPNNRTGHSATSCETHLIGHDGKPCVLPPEGSRSPNSKAFTVRLRDLSPSLCTNDMQHQGLEPSPPSMAISVQLHCLPPWGGTWRICQENHPELGTLCIQLRLTDGRWRRDNSIVSSTTNHLGRLCLQERSALQVSHPPEPSRASNHQITKNIQGTDKKTEEEHISTKQRPH
jgi:hypothetical protein